MVQNARIVDLAAATGLTGAEQIELVQNSVSAKTTLAAVLALADGTIPVIATTTFTAAASNLVIADTTTGAFTITLPSTAVFGNIIWFVDGAGTWATNNLTLNGNGLNIVGTTENLIVDINRDNFYLVYYNAPQGWIIGN